VISKEADPPSVPESLGSGFSTNSIPPIIASRYYVALTKERHGFLKPCGIMSRKDRIMVLLINLLNKSTNTRSSSGM
jgi:hypothetical protein